MLFHHSVIQMSSLVVHIDTLSSLSGALEETGRNGTMGTK